MRLILHVGRHKTGTSSLQRFFSRNAKELSKMGVLYPASGRSGIAHHLLAEILSRKSTRLAPEESVKRSNDLLTALTKEVQAGHHTVILSSEAFQNSNPEFVRQALDGWDVTVVMYLREQYQYLISAYQQKVHAQLYIDSLSEFSREFNPDYLKFVNSWVESFGESGVSVNVFEKASLASGDIVKDFLSKFVTVESDSLAFDGSDANPSIGGCLLEVKRILNERSHGAQLPRRLYGELSRQVQSSPRYSLRPAMSATMRDEFRAKYIRGNENIRARYFSNVIKLFGVAKFEEEPLIEIFDLRDEICQAIVDLRKRVANWQNRQSDEDDLLNELSNISMKLQSNEAELLRFVRNQSNYYYYSK